MFFTKRQKNNFDTYLNRGFSIPEMIVALFFFSMIMVIAVGTVLAVTTANRKAFALSNTNNSMVYAIDSMIKDMRTGTNYDCGPLGGDKNCPLFLGLGEPSNSFYFTDDRGQNTGYRLNGNKIQKLISGNFLDITSPEIKVNKLDFYVEVMSKKLPEINFCILLPFNL
jgi:type II secretory pathway component PulJ